MNREKKPSEFEHWKDYVSAKQMKYYWRDKITRVFGSFPTICPLTTETKEDDDKLRGCFKCSLYEPNKETTAGTPPRVATSKDWCECFSVYWRCSLFKKWLAVIETNKKLHKGILETFTPKESEYEDPDTPREPTHEEELFQASKEPEYLNDGQLLPEDPLDVFLANMRAGDKFVVEDKKDKTPQNSV